MKSLIVTIFNILLLVTITSCSEDEKKLSASKMVFKLKDNSVSHALEEGSLFLIKEDVEEEFGYRDYVITDGEFIEGEDGDHLNDYTNATYFIFIQLATRDDFSPANYVQSTAWSNEPGDFYSYLYATSPAEKTFFTDTDNSPVIISGELDAGGTMRLKFDGELMYARLDPSSGNVLNSMEEVELFFEGKVINKR